MKIFSISRLPELVFGEGRLSELPAILGKRGIRSVALITGGASFRKTEAYERLRGDLASYGITGQEFSVSREPSPEIVDSITQELTASGAKGRGDSERKAAVEGVLAIGGGSVIDAAKAVAAMLTMEGSTADYLESVGEKTPTGTRLPLFAVPTTSGTGTEATKNAVLSRVGEGGFKKSLRHDNLVPDLALIDPLLTLSCPPEVTAASGLDAITQLIEAYTSVRATPFTDALALGALETAGRAFPRVCKDGSDKEARAGMAYAAYISGICLAHAGLGVVHGIASPLGGLFPVPHGVVCGTLVAEATRYTLARAIRIDDPSENSVLHRYARAGMALSGRDADSDNGNAALLVTTLERYIRDTSLPALGAFGITRTDARRVAEKVDAKNHPIPLTVDDITSIIEGRL
jgi:alcohol dehydrogenase class IV